MYDTFFKSMRKDPQTRIKMARVLASIIGSRDVVDSLKTRIFESDTRSVVLDFENVQFISRSAAHEMLLMKEELRQRNKELSFENANQDIAEMLRVVAANRALPNVKQPNFKPEKISIDSLRRELAI